MTAVTEVIRECSTKSDGRDGQRVATGCDGIELDTLDSVATFLATFPLASDRRDRPLRHARV
jgi:hypothetical protein